MTNEKKQEVIESMEAITITVFLRSDGDYDYQVWPYDLAEAATRSEGDETMDEGADNGGVCTGNMGDALEMAKDAALAVVRNHFSDNCFNPDVCPSSLDENGEPSTSGETAHKWSEPFKNFEQKKVRECAECGAIDEMTA